MYGGTMAGRGGAVALAAMLLSLAACVTGGAGAPTQSASRTCDSLTEDRRKIVRTLDAAEHGRAAPNSTAGLFLLAGLLTGRLTAGASQGISADMARKDKESAMMDLRAKQTNLDEAIDEKQCTLEAKAKYGLTRAADDARYDGRYAGKGSTDSWCAQPSLSLTIKAGRLSGNLKESVTATASYEIKGQLYEAGGIALSFKRPGSTVFTDDFDGQLKDDTLSFSAGLDASPKACVYRFAVKRSSQASD
jgi:hypothetical protein